MMAGSALRSRFGVCYSNLHGLYIKSKSAHSSIQNPKVCNDARDSVGHEFFHVAGKWAYGRFVE
jgi:hypothetical protein